MSASNKIVMASTLATDVDEWQRASAEVQHVNGRLVYQLLHGCGDETCRQVLCHSGRRNNNKINNSSNTPPIRPYSLRAARAIALLICAGPDPRRHLCPRCTPTTHDGGGHDAGHDQPERRDPSSLMQLLCDTSPIKQLQDSVHVEAEPHLVQLHAKVSSLLRRCKGADMLSNADLAQGLLACIYALLDQLPMQRLAPWTMVNRDIVSKGFAYPPKHTNLPVDANYNTWLEILDKIDDGSCLRLFQRIMLVTGRRKALECSLHAADNYSPRFCDANRSVEGLLAHALCSRGEDSTIPAFATVVWLKKLLTKSWNACPFVHRADVCFAILETLRSIELHARQCRLPFPEDTFDMPVLSSQAGMVELCRSFANPQPKGSKTTPLLRWSFLFSPQDLTLAFRTVNHLTMRETHAAVEGATLLRRRMSLDLEYGLPEQILHSEKHYLLLTVDRGNVLHDTFDQLWQRRKSELRRPLRVRLGEANELELGHDLGGVQIEFFNLVCKEIFAQEAQMFTTDPTTGYSYFRPGSLQPLYMFNLFGLLVALAMYNGITLPINLPRVFYLHMITSPDKTSWSQELCPSDISDAWPQLSRSLQSILDTDEGMYGLDFTFPLEANGVRLAVQPPPWPRAQGSYVVNVTHAASLEGEDIPKNSLYKAWPGWVFMDAHADTQVDEVTTENKALYVQSYINFLVDGSVKPQLDAFSQGFRSAELFKPHTLTLFTPQQLKAHVEGTSHLDINDLKQATCYDGYDAKSKYINSFWRIVTAWPESKQKQLLKFVTAAERIPITGAKTITFIIKRSTPESVESLPTSSTCFGTLLLPRYPNADILAAKLSLSLKYGTEGFGTG